MLVMIHMIYLHDGKPSDRCIDAANTQMIEPLLYKQIIVHNIRRAPLVMAICQQ
ncbi:hypothetical protein X975_13191, partial [Stegodyphus mimosarum]